MNRPADVKNAVLKLTQDAGVKQIRFLYCDNAGIIRGKVCGHQVLDERMQGGIGLAVAAQALNSLDEIQPVEGLGSTGEVRLLPDPRTFRVIPYAPHSAVMLCDMVEPDGSPWEVCPRYYLRRQIERAQMEFGISIITAFEPEWSLARRGPDGSYTAVDDSLTYSTIGMTTTATVIDEIISALETQNLKLEQYHPERGHGQQELSITAARALEAADNQLIYRETVRAVAWNQGMVASFAPKPFHNQAGNGSHVHISAWAGDRGDLNMFYDPSDHYSLSQLGYYFIGGILEHLPALTALTCPSVNSFRRLKPGTWASAFTAYGPDNREAAVRIVSPLLGKESSSVNLEIRPVDNTCNPYLALGAIIAAGLDGVEKSNYPRENLLALVDPDTIPEEERIRRGILPLPASLGEALDLLESSPVLVNSLGPRLANAFFAVKRSEVRTFGARDSDFEINHHFFKY